MNLGIGIVCGLVLVGTATITALQAGSPQAATKGLPEIESGKTVTVDWRGTGQSTGEIMQVNGSWVKLRFTTADKTPPGDAGASVSAALDVWVNFDKLSYYLAPRQKK